MNHFRTYRALMNNNSKHMANLLFFELLRLTFMYKVYDLSAIASEYSKQTIIRPMNSPFTLRDTEVKSLLRYFNDIHDNDSVLSKNDNIFLNQVNVDDYKILTYLRKMMNMSSLGTHADIMLKQLQKDLKVDDPKLRAMLTLVIKWETLTGNDMRLLVERIKNFGLLHLRHSKLTKEINKFANEKSVYVKDEDGNKKVTPMDVMLGLITGLSAKWSYDSRNKNKKSFERLKDTTTAMDYESNKK